MHIPCDGNTGSLGFPSAYIGWLTLSLILTLHIVTTVIAIAIRTPLTKKKERHPVCPVAKVVDNDRRARLQLIEPSVYNFVIDIHPPPILLVCCDGVLQLFVVEPHPPRHVAWAGLGASLRLAEVAALLADVVNGSG